MSEVNNQWEKRVERKFTCVSGNEVMIRRSSPSLALKSQKFLPILKRISGPDGKAKADEQIAKILELPDAELERLTSYAEIVIADAVTQPVLNLNPKKGELSPNDIPLNDFWQLFIYIGNGCPEIPVKTKDGETDIESVANFPVEQTGSVGAGTDSEQIQ